MSGEAPPEEHNGGELGPRDHEVAETLAHERPTPRSRFRAALARHLAARDPGYGPRPAHLRVIVAVCWSSGIVLIGLSLIQATGSL